MKLKVWAKTMLTVQRHLEKVTKALDELIYKKAISSAFVTSKNLMEQTCQRLGDFIINVSETKVNLINLNTICVSALKGIDKTSAKILILKHIENKTSADIFSLLNMSERTYFRKLNLAYEKLESWLFKNGFTSDYFMKKYSNEGWIMEAYYKNLEFFNENKQDVVDIEVGLLSKIVKDISRSAHSSYS